MLNIKDVAREAGVSPAVVSRVLNGHPNIRPLSRKAVEEAIAHLNYIPKPRGRQMGYRPSLKSNLKSIALVVNERLQDHFGDSFYGPFYSSLENFCSELQYEIHVIANFTKISLSNSYVGAIILANDHALAEKAFGELPLIQVMGSVSGLETWDRVSYNNKAIGRLAAMHFSNLHKKRVAVISTPNRLFDERKSGFIQTISELGLECIDTPDDLQSALKTSTDPQNKVEAIFACDDSLLPPLCSILQFQNITPMKDLTVLGCNAMKSVLSQIHPTPHSINLHGESIARLALNQLILRMRHPELPITHIQLSPSLFFME